MLFESSEPSNNSSFTDFLMNNLNTVIDSEALVGEFFNESVPLSATAMDESTTTTITITSLSTFGFNPSASSSSSSSATTTPNGTTSILPATGLYFHGTGPVNIFASCKLNNDFNFDSNPSSAYVSGDEADMDSENFSSESGWSSDELSTLRSSANSSDNESDYHRDEDQSQRFANLTMQNSTPSKTVSVSRSQKKNSKKQQQERSGLMTKKRSSQQISRPCSPLSDPGTRGTHKLYVCNECPFTTPWRSNMARHKRRHSGEKPYLCQFCQHAFANSSNRKKHELTCKHSTQRIAKTLQSDSKTTKKSRVGRKRAHTQ